MNSEVLIELTAKTIWKSKNGLWEVQVFENETAGRIIDHEDNRIIYFVVPEGHDLPVYTSRGHLPKYVIRKMYTLPSRFCPWLKKTHDEERNH